MTTATAINLPPGVQSYLRRYARRRNGQQIVRRAGLAMVITLIWAAAWCLIDRAVALPAAGRVALLVMNATIGVVLVGPTVGRMLRGMDLRLTAREIERREPDWQERLATLASRALGPARFIGSQELLSALAADVEAEATRRSPADLLPWSAAMRPWIASGVVLVSVASLAFIPTLDVPRLMRRYITPMANVAPAATTRLFVTPGDVRIAAGEALRVRTSVQRMTSGAPMLHVRTSDGRDWIAQPMSATTEGAFEARVPNLESDLKYFVTGGDARSDIFRATVLRRPALVALRTTLTYPPYLKLPARQLADSDATIEVPTGTEMLLEIVANEPLSVAKVVIGNHGNGTTPTAQPHVRQAKITASEPGPLSIRMTSSAGVAGTFTGGQVRIITDRPPVVTVEPATAQNPPNRLNYHVVDDLALSRIDVEISRGYGQQKVLPLPLTGDVHEQSGTLVLHGPKLGLAAGEIVDVHLRAEDRAGHLIVTRATQMSVSGEAASGTAVEAAPQGSQVIDPPEFKGPLDAYFQVISRPVGR